MKTGPNTLARAETSGRIWGSLELEGLAQEKRAQNCVTILGSWGVTNVGLPVLRRKFHRDVNLDCFTGRDISVSFDDNVPSLATAGISGFRV